MGLSLWGALSLHQGLWDGGKVRENTFSLQFPEEVRGCAMESERR